MILCAIEVHLLTYLLTYLYFGGRKLLQRGAAVYALLIYERHFKFDRMS